MDENGYPTQAELKAIREWDHANPRGLFAYIRDEVWCWPHLIREGPDGIWYMSTGGWSGNEEVIDALQQNTMFWLFYWKKSERGGHFEFDLSRALPKKEQDESGGPAL